MNRRKKGRLRKKVSTPVKENDCGGSDEDENEDQFQDAEETLENGVRAGSFLLETPKSGHVSPKYGVSDLNITERRPSSSPVSRMDSVRSSAASIASAITSKDRPPNFSNNDGPTQYTVTEKETRNNWFCSGGESAKLQGFLNWAFDAGYTWVFLFFLFLYVLITVIFGFLIIWSVSRLDNHCKIATHDGNPDIKPSFLEAYALSWTTFSTVGYGNVYPSADTKAQCWLTNIICTIESFCGLVYVGFCGAVIFSKVMTVQSQAQVVFSCPMVIRYTSKGTQSQSNFLPFPVLEFRLANTDQQDGGHIFDTTLLAAVCMKLAPRTVRPDNFFSKAIRAGDAELSEWSSNVDSFHSERSSFMAPQDPPPRTKFTFLKKRRKSELEVPVGIDRNPSDLDDPFDEGSRIPSKTYKTLHLINHFHPYLSRSWKVRHRLDLESPLLSNKVKQEIRKNEGKWPSSLNAADDIINDFEHIIISCNGISNMSASTVFAQNIYKPNSICNGFRFADMNVIKDGEEISDLRLMNDIINEMDLESSDGSSSDSDEEK